MAYLVHACGVFFNINFTLQQPKCFAWQVNSEEMSFHQLQRGLALGTDHELHRYGPGSPARPVSVPLPPAAVMCDLVTKQACLGQTLLSQQWCKSIWEEAEERAAQISAVFWLRAWQVPSSMCQVSMVCMGSPWGRISQK